MNIKVNCKYCESNSWCSNENIKRSLWGIGARLCNIPDGGTCKYQDGTKKSNIRPVPLKKPKTIII